MSSGGGKRLAPSPPAKFPWFFSTNSQASIDCSTNAFHPSPRHHSLALPVIFLPIEELVSSVLHLLPSVVHENS